jgi:hypothetical protein
MKVGSIQSLGSNRDEAIARGDWKAYTTLLPNVNAVTAERVQSVSRKYLRDEKCTVGYFIPKKGDSEIAEVEQVALVTNAPSPMKTAAVEQSSFEARVKEFNIHGNGSYQ